MIVMKFGGSSLADAERLRRVGALVRRVEAPCVVLSAIGDTTDQLLAAHRHAIAGHSEHAARTLAAVFDAAAAIAAELLAGDRWREAFDRLRRDAELILRGTARPDRAGQPLFAARAADALLAYGERLSTLLLTAHLVEIGAAAVEVDAREIVATDASFGRARPDRGTILQRAHQSVAPHVANGRTVVTQGFVGAAPDGATTTLGRGGSDWSAALIGAALVADELQIWTDVEGVLTADPRRVASARPIADLTPDEAAELAAFGARVLHPSTIQPVVDKNIPVTVRHTLRPDGRFTRIERIADSARRGIAALASRGPVTVVTMTSRRMLEASGYLAKLFEVFGELDIPVDLVATAEVSVACTVEADAPIDRVVAALDGLAHVDVRERCAIVAAIGDGLQHTERVLERACRALHPIEPQMVSYGGNSRNLSFVVRSHEQDDAVRRLHDEFFPATADDALAGTATQERSR